MSIVMTGGGTGGHLVIIKAVKEELRGEELVYIGSTKGQDQKWFGEDGDFAAKYFLDTRGVVNQGIIGKFRSLFMLLKATLEASSLLKKHDAKAVFCVGGFSAAPTSLAAILRRIPLVIHEQNAAIGSLNRLLRPFARAFISSYIEESPVSSYPIKKIFFEERRLRDKVTTVIFLGGSQGAKAINDLAISLAPLLREKGISIIHQSGEKDYERVQNAYESMGIEAELFPFTSDPAGYMRRADLAIARAGASTLWELSAMGLPAVYIPYPYAAGDHQYYNAKFLVDNGLGWMMREGEIDMEKVLGIIDGSVGQQSRGLIGSVKSDGAGEIALLLREAASK